MEKGHTPRIPEPKVPAGPTFESVQQADEAQVRKYLDWFRGLNRRQRRSQERATGQKKGARTRGGGLR